MDFTERPLVDGLRLADYIPLEIIEKEEIAQRGDNNHCDARGYEIDKSYAKGIASK
jgi:hypothetical protein